MDRCHADLHTIRRPVIPTFTRPTLDLRNDVLRHGFPVTVAGDRFQSPGERACLCLPVVLDTWRPFGGGTQQTRMETEAI